MFRVVCCCIGWCCIGGFPFVVVCFSCLVDLFVWVVVMPVFVVGLIAACWVGYCLVFIEWVGFDVVLKRFCWLDLVVWRIVVWCYFLFLVICLLATWIVVHLVQVAGLLVFVW